MTDGGNTSLGSGERGERGERRDMGGRSPLVLKVDGHHPANGMEVTALVGADRAVTGPDAVPVVLVPQVTLASAHRLEHTGSDGGDDEPAFEDEPVGFCAGGLPHDAFPSSGK